MLNKKQINQGWIGHIIKNIQHRYSYLKAYEKITKSIDLLDSKEVCKLATDLNLITSIIEPIAQQFHDDTYSQYNKNEHMAVRYFCRQMLILTVHSYETTQQRLYIFDNVDDLSMMVDDALFEKIKSFAIRQYKEEVEAAERAKNPQPVVEVSQYYPKGRF